MKLSDAMMLGSTTCKMVAGDWNSCAIGCSGNAVGIANVDTPKGYGRIAPLMDYWPWLTSFIGQDVWFKFDTEVCRGTMTFEQLVDWVQTVEPSCGECNRFECKCAAVPEAKEQVEVWA